MYTLPTTTHTTGSLTSLANTTTVAYTRTLQHPSPTHPLHSLPSSIHVFSSFPSITAHSHQPPFIKALTKAKKLHGNAIPRDRNEHTEDVHKIQHLNCVYGQSKRSEARVGKRTRTEIRREAVYIRFSVMTIQVVFRVFPGKQKKSMFRRKIFGGIGDVWSYCNDCCGTFSL